MELWPGLFSLAYYKRIQEPVAGVMGTSESVVETAWPCLGRQVLSNSLRCPETGNQEGEVVDPAEGAVALGWRGMDSEEPRSHLPGQWAWKAHSLAWHDRSV